VTIRRAAALLTALALGVAGCGSDGDAGGGGESSAPQLTIYSGRNEQLVGPVIAQFEGATGIDVEVRYGDTAQLAGAILEEGDNSPADVYFGQDAGALGALSDAGRFRPLDAALLDRVDQQYRSVDGDWVGVSGRVRVAVYNTGLLTQSALPASVLDLTQPRWKGKVGWAPTNGSFQAFVTAMRVALGDEGARAWLEGMKANETKAFENNIAIVEAAAAGEIQLGLANHYYLHRFLAEDPAYPAANHVYPNGDIGSLVNVAGVGILDTADQADAAQRLVEFLLGEDAQRYFAEETFEIPLVQGIEADPSLPDLATLQQPDIDLNGLADLQGTLALLTEVGVI
jgi:iron(III) transport system substrate-binding protein